MEAASSARPLPRFDYAPNTGCEPSHRHAPVCLNATLPDLGTAGKVNYSLNTVRNTFLTNRPVRSARANLEGKLKDGGEPLSIASTANARAVPLETGANGHTTAECRELRKALHGLADKGQIAWFLKRGPRFLREEREPARPESRDEECSTVIVAPIAGGYAECITWST
ncbi:hypothetical protein Cgig2_032778 [Carnegiea gigantea]|uniref:Uncharacterized protein n=1 Tax=Carnegiea gigantea TaxID=171969 RepID=A0A9Q1GYW4_9CARY|nr:hypothetical protein Cgig2_032778 [Carnegiea gigantea]